MSIESEWKNLKETMMTYIEEEEQVCQLILNNYEKNLQDYKDTIINNHVKNWLIIATGSSYNAALSAKYYIQNISEISIEVVEPFTFLNYDKIKQSTDFVLAISQSGHSRSTIEALKKVNLTRNFPIAVLTANVTSPITKYADTIINIGCGEEKVGFVTKGFTATVLNLMLMGLVSADAYGSINHAKQLEELYDFENIIKQIPKVVNIAKDFYQQNYLKLNSINRLSIIGYGPTYGTAKEGETKFTETIRIPTHGHELEAFMHGPYLEINKNYGLFFIFNESPNKNRAIKLRDYLQKYTNHCYAVTTGIDPIESSISINFNIDEFKSPLLLTIPFQVLAYLVSVGRGIDLNKKYFPDFYDKLESKL